MTNTCIYRIQLMAAMCLYYAQKITFTLIKTFIRTIFVFYYLFKVLKKVSHSCGKQYGCFYNVHAQDHDQSCHTSPIQCPFWLLRKLAMFLQVITIAQPVIGSLSHIINVIYQDAMTYAFCPFVSANVYNNML